MPVCSARAPSASLWTLTLAAWIIMRDDNPAAEGHLGHDTIYVPAPSCVASRWHAADAAGRYRPFPAPRVFTQAGAWLGGAGARICGSHARAVTSLCCHHAFSAVMINASIGMTTAPPAVQPRNLTGRCDALGNRPSGPAPLSHSRHQAHDLVRPPSPHPPGAAPTGQRWPGQNISRRLQPRLQILASLRVLSSCFPFERGH